MNDEKSGVQAAVATIADAGVALLDVDDEGKEWGQLPLLETGADDDGIIAVANARRGAGRPKGAKNKRTAEWVEYLLGRYRSPLVVLAETYSRPVVELARELNCKREDAMKMQISAATALAPFVHQKQPLMVNVDRSGVVTLVIVDGARVHGEGQGDETTVFDGEFVEANQ